MTSYIVANGRLEPRQKDYNIPNYRIIPYRSTLNPTMNDYYNNTINQLKKQNQKLQADYRNLSRAMWKIISEVDRTHYDSEIVFFGLKTQEIYDKITLLRSVHIYQPEQEFLKLSAIVKVDNNEQSYSNQTPPNPQNLNSMTCLPSQNDIRQDSLYEIQQQEEVQDSKLGYLNSFALKRQLNIVPTIHLTHVNETSQTNVVRLSLTQISNPRKEARRSSFMLKQRISLALHQQQELRQILEDELDKMSQQLDQKNQYLQWTVQELKTRNQLTQKLRDLISLRDQIFEEQQSTTSYTNQIPELGLNAHTLEQKDREIGQVINTLIQRTEQTTEDFQFLTQSLGILAMQTNQNQQTDPESLNQNQNTKFKENNNSVSLEEIPYEMRSQISSGKDEEKRILQQLKSQLNTQMPQKIISFPSQLIPVDQNELVVVQEALKPKNFNVCQDDKHKPVVLLTKQHFWQAQKKLKAFLQNKSKNQPQEKQNPGQIKEQRCNIVRIRK